MDSYMYHTLKTNTSRTISTNRMIDLESSKTWAITKAKAQSQPITEVEVTTLEDQDKEIAKRAARSNHNNTITSRS